MPDIVLATLNAKYIHASFGLRCLLANLGDLRAQARLMEFDLNRRPLEVAEDILRENPRIVGLGVYIWNAAESLELVALLKRLEPDLLLVLGGPEVSYEIEPQAIARLADYVIAGEADQAFAGLCRRLLAGERPREKVVNAPLPDLGTLVPPYDFYTDEDLRHRVVYVEASRGCPFTCEFCLSSLDIPVRQFPLAEFLEQMDRLLARGLLQFKFVDRTFNLNLKVCRTLLGFFLQRLRPGLFLHFEMIPDRLPPEVREWIVRFPAGSLQFEVGIQTFNPEVADRIRRRQDFTRTEENLRFLREQTGVHIHADLIVGLPGESLESFAQGFDRLVALGPHEIQVGILKRLRGTPIGRHDTEWDMVYRPDPPYEILRNRLIDFPTFQRLRRFARLWDRVANSGRFVETTPLLWSQSTSPFQAFLCWSDWVHRTLGRQHGIALDRLAEALFLYLTDEGSIPPEAAALTLAADYQRAGSPDLPPFLRGHVPSLAGPRSRPGRRTLRRQVRHHRLAVPEPGISGEGPEAPFRARTG